MSGTFSYKNIPGKVFGAVAEGRDVRELDADSFRDLYAAFLKFGFLVMPGQHLSEAENIQFAERFGKLEFGALPLAVPFMHNHEDLDHVARLRT
jgi:alpha-ketoglutarate-dependent taurine dioxygenase